MIGPVLGLIRKGTVKKIDPVNGTMIVVPVDKGDTLSTPIPPIPIPAFPIIFFGTSRPGF